MRSTPSNDSPRESLDRADGPGSAKSGLADGGSRGKAGGAGSDSLLGTRLPMRTAAPGAPRPAARREEPEGTELPEGSEVPEDLELPGRADKPEGAEGQVVSEGLAVSEGPEGP